MSNSPPQTPSFRTFPPINPHVHTPSSQCTSASSSSNNTQSASSSTQSPSTSTSSQTPIMAGIHQNPPPTPPPVRPWENPRAVKIPTHLHPLPKHPERCLPKFNLGDGLLVEEHLHNYMLAINLNGVVEEDYVVRLFPYTFEGSLGSWYFSLPSGSITIWDIFEEQFFTKFGVDRTTATLINDLSNLKASPNQKINDFNSRFKKLLNKIPDTSKPGIDLPKSGIYLPYLQISHFLSIGLIKLL